MNGVGESAMAAFNGAVLIGGISASKMDIVAISREQIACVRILIELARLVQNHILILAVWAVLSEEVFKPVKRSGFGDPCVTMLHLREVVGHEDPCGFAIHAFKIFAAIRIFPCHTREREIN